MACSPNWQEYAAAGKADKMAVTIHDERYGAYKNNVPEDNKKTVAPPAAPSPFKLGSGK